MRCWSRSKSRRSPDSGDDEDDLAVDDALVGEVGEDGLDDVGEVARHRLLVARPDLDEVTGPEDDRPEAVPLRLVEHLDLDGREVLDRLGQHRRHRRDDRHTPRRAQVGVALGLGGHVLGVGLVLATLARLHARRLARHLRVVGREVQLAEPALADVLVPQGDRGRDVTDLVVDAGPGVAAVGDELRHGAHRELLRVDRRELVPRDRRRDRRARERPGRVGRCDGAVAAGLVEVDEDLLAALLLPPRGRHEVGQPALELARDADDAVTHVEELVGRRDPRVDVHAAVAGRLGPRGQPDLGHDLAQREGGLDRVLEAPARLRVEVDAQLVRLVDVGRADRPRVEGDGVHLRGPHGIGDLVDDELRVLAARRIGAHDRARALGHALGRVLGEELLALDALREALERHRPVAERAQHRVGDGDEVVRHVELRHRLAVGHPGCRPQHPVGARDAHLPHPRTGSTGLGAATTSGLGAHPPIVASRRARPRRTWRPRASALHSSRGGDAVSRPG